MPTPMSDTLPLVADDALADVADLLTQVLAAIADALPDLANDQRIRELLTTTIRDTVVAALTVFSTRSAVSDATAPAAGLELARRLAQLGVPLSDMLRAYRLGQSAFQQELITRIAARHVSAGEIATAATQLSSVAFSFLDGVTEEVVAAYQAERDNWMRQRNAARLAKVTSILASGSSTVDDAESALGYGIAGSHVGAVLWCGQDAGEPNRLAALERLVTQITAAVATRPPLVVAPDGATLWAWFPASTAPIEQLTAVLDAAAPGTYLAMGDPARGLPGFRQTHHQAQQAHTIAMAADPAHRLRVTSAALLGPVALLTMDPPSAATWVQSVLGELADDDEQHARMRETIWAYLSAGGSLTAAATALHLHKNTIQYRVRKAEEARGRPFTDNRLDVEVALLACRLLGSTVLRPVGAPGA